MSTVMVFNLPKNVTENDLRETFGRIGKLTDVQQILSMDGEICYFSLISYETEEEAEIAAHLLDKTTMFSVNIRVERCNSRVIKSKNDFKCNTNIHSENVQQATTTNDEISQEQNVKNTALVHSSSDVTDSPPTKGQQSLTNLSQTPQRHNEHFTSSKVTNNKVDIPYKNIVKEYEQLYMLNFDETIYSLINDKTSNVHTKHKFVNSILVASLRCSPNNITDAGKLFVELLSNQILSTTVITEEIDTILKNHNTYLNVYPRFFSYIAASVSQLLISNTTLFQFNNVKDTFVSLTSNKSTMFFVEVLKNIFNSDKNIKDHNSVVCLYKKWWFSKCIHFDIFSSHNLINEYYKINHVGVFLLSMTIYNQLKLNDGKLLNDIMHSWINTCFEETVIKCPHFIQALTIAIVLTNLTSNDDILFEDFIDHAQAKFLAYYILYVRHETIERELQCMYGVQMMSVVFDYPKDAVLKLCHKLCQDYNVISEESYRFLKHLQNIVF